MFLYEEMDRLRRNGAMLPLPAWIRDSLNPRMPLRPYQEAALENFITYFAGPNDLRQPCQVLFHMATGSGKTLLMAGLMVYLYQQGYRNFLFFVNLTAIVQQTRTVFLNPASSKYLFAPALVIGGQRVRVQEVPNFQAADPDAINLLFTTTQGLHTDLRQIRENGLSPEDFTEAPVVLISDEAHHLNAATKRMGQADADSQRTWEESVRRVFRARPDNVLLEFTATCDLKDPRILEAYRDKILFNYPLQNFRADRYSKEIATLRTDLSPMDRALLALVLSQYRLKLFQAHRLSIKPVVLFKSVKIRESAAFQAAFAERLRTLSGDSLRPVTAAVFSPVLEQALTWFSDHGVSLDALAQELRQDFSPERCISVNDDADAVEKQLPLNSLEDPGNPYRAVFEVKKLDEGWDVLNLFDIVRLYEARQSGGRRVSASTVSEAQLIGRGARYCPFQLSPDQPRYQRKYDPTPDNPLRICETLYYHCQSDSRYIGELHTALREIGLASEASAAHRLRLKASFQSTPLYREGFVYTNRRLEHAPDPASAELPASLRERDYTAEFPAGAAGEDLLLESIPSSEPVSHLRTFRITFRQLADLNYAIVHKALVRYPVFRFDALKRRFPDLASTRMFVTDPRYLGAVRLTIRSHFEQPPARLLFRAACQALGELAQAMTAGQSAWTGSREFLPRPMAAVFPGEVLGRVPAGESPQNWSALSQEPWYAREADWGAAEELAMAEAVGRQVPLLRDAWDEVWLLRCGGRPAFYAFADGARLAPDFLLFLRRGTHWVQALLAAKGRHGPLTDRKMASFLAQLEGRAVPAGERIRLLGLPLWDPMEPIPFDAALRRLASPPEV